MKIEEIKKRYFLYFLPQMQLQELCKHDAATTRRNWEFFFSQSSSRREVREGAGSNCPKSRRTNRSQVRNSAIFGTNAFVLETISNSCILPMDWVMSCSHKWVAQCFAGKMGNHHGSSEQDLEYLLWELPIGLGWKKSKFISALLTASER